MEFLVNLEVDDPEKAVAFCGAAFGPRVGRRFGAAGVRLALMADPFGHGFCSVQFLGWGYDEFAG